jgi:hypothetical protein
MKKLITSVALVLAGAVAFAQDNYTIKSSVKIEGLPAEYSAFGESDKITYLKDSKSKVETSNMMGSTIEVFDGSKMTVLMEQMGDKSGWSATKEEMEKTKDDPKKDAQKPKIETTTEKKTIAGYECVKSIVTVTDKDKKQMKINIWHTDKIKKPVTGSSKKKGGMGGGNFDFAEITGYPMSVDLETENQGMKIKYIETVTEVSTDKLDDGVFVADTDGYKMISFGEYREQLKKAMAEK